MHALSRRDFLQTSALGLTTALNGPSLLAQEPGDRPARADRIEVLNPAARVPVSLIIDDSTCLVNLAHYCIPQFAEARPNEFKQDWRKLPREIPDAFVRKFGEWCHTNGVKGKYSIVPYPACVGWVDREMPGWTRKELEASLDLVRTLMMPDWDIHPELMTHTWGVDTKTGRAYPDRTDNNMENWGFSVGKSADFLADYFSYAYRILKNVGLTCEGLTTPGGFGNRVLPALSQATLEATRDVFSAETPHYFRHWFVDHRSVAPRIEYAAGFNRYYTALRDGKSADAAGDPRCVVSIIGCTGDWFGSWDGLQTPEAEKYIAADLRGGRLPQVIARGEPAVLVCHWAGIYCNGDETGFRAFRDVVQRLHAAHDNLQWMKLSEIARYWAAKELTQIEPIKTGFILRAPYAAPQFTLRYKTNGGGLPTFTHAGKQVVLTEVDRLLQLKSNTWLRERDQVTVCFDLSKGETTIVT